MEPPFVGPTYNLESRPSGVQRTINMCPVPQEPGNERTRWVFEDVPGLRQAVEDSAWLGSQAMYLFHFQIADPNEFADSSTAIDQTGASWAHAADISTNLEGGNFKFGLFSFYGGVERSISATSFSRNGKSFTAFDGWIYIDSIVTDPDTTYRPPVVTIQTKRISGTDGSNIVVDMQFSTDALGLVTDSKISFYPQDDSTTPAQKTNLPVDEWFHVRANLYFDSDADQGTMRLWVNGVLADGIVVDMTDNSVNSMGTLGPSIIIGPTYELGAQHVVLLDEAYGVMGTTINEDGLAFTPPTAEWPNP